jgi:HTH-type transcriptional regulator, sugar sensing transcriptional regulator
MEDIILELMKFGISKREAEVYVALLQKKELTAPEIAKITSVARTKSYEILQNLVKKKMCNENFRNGTKLFSSIEPKIALQNVLAVHENELNKKREMVLNLGETLTKLFNEKEKFDSPLDYIEVISDPGTLKAKWMEFEKNMKEEFLVFVKAPYAINFADNIEEEKDVIRNNVKVKGLYEYGNLKTKEEFNNLTHFMKVYQKIGEEVRVYKELPMKLAIIDDTVSMISLADRVSIKPELTTMIVNHPSLANAMKTVFYSYWNMGITVTELEKLITKGKIKTEEI